MARTEAGNGNYVVAAAVGGLCGGIAALLATRGLPKMLSEVKEHMHEICGETCGCIERESAPETTEESSEATCN